MNLAEEHRDQNLFRGRAASLSRKRRLIYIFTVYLVFALVLVAIEAVTRVTLPNISSLDLFVTTTQQRAQVANPQQSTIFEGDPLLLWRLKPNLRNAVWDFTVLSTNSDGYRSESPVREKKANAFRVVCLGDSVTFGYRVPPVWPEKPTEFNPEWLPYPMLLERQLRAANPNREIEVVTMAVPGYTSHQGLAWLRRDIDTLQPDLVIVGFGWNDVSLSDVSDREAISTTWYAQGVRWFIHHSQAFAHATKWLRSKKSHTSGQSVKPVPRVSLEEYLDNMMTITNLVHSRGGTSIVLAATYRDTVTNPGEAELMKRYRSSLKSVMERNNVSFLQIPELTEEAYPSNEGWFGELIHPNHMGHRLIASELLKLLARESLRPELNITELTP